MSHKHTLYLVTAHNLLSKAQTPQNIDQYIFIGNNYHNYQECKKLFPRLMPLGGKIIDAQLAAHQDELKNLDEFISKSICSNPYLISFISELTPLNSIFLEMVCKWFAFIDIIKENSSKNFLLLFDKSENLVLWTNLLSANHIPYSVISRTYISKALSILKHYIFGAINICRVFKELCQAKWLLFRTAKNRFKHLSHSDLIVVTWSKADTFPTDRPLNQSEYFGRLLEEFRKQHHLTTFIAMPLFFLQSSFKIISANLNAFDNVCFIYDFAKIKDYLLGLLCYLRIILKKKHLKLNSTCLTPLLNYLIYRNIGTFLRLYIYEKSFSRLAKMLNKCAHIKRDILYPYENQSWEKLLLENINSNNPQIISYGYFFNYLPSVFLSIFPSKRQIKNDLFPSILMVTGEAVQEHFVPLGISQARIRTVGAYRYEDILSKNKIESFSNNNLCITSIEYYNSMETTIKSLKYSMQKNESISICLHPAMAINQRRQIEKFITQFAKNNHFWNYQIYVGLKTVPFTPEKVFYGISFAGVEALLLGCNVEYIETELSLNCDHLEQVKEKPFAKMRSIICSRYLHPPSCFTRTARKKTKYYKSNFTDIVL